MKLTKLYMLCKEMILVTKQINLYAYHKVCCHKPNEDVEVLAWLAGAQQSYICFCAGVVSTNYVE